MCQKGDFKEMSCLGKLTEVRLPEPWGLWMQWLWPLEELGLEVPGPWEGARGSVLRAREALSYPLIPTFMLIY